MTEAPTEIVIEEELAAPPARVWRAMSDPALGGRWLPPGGVRTAAGERFTVETDGRRVDCEVLESDPPRRLRLAWVEQGGGVASEVIFTLTPSAAGARLRIVHSAAAAARLPPRAVMRCTPAAAAGWKMAA